MVGRQGGALVCFRPHARKIVRPCAGSPGAWLPTSLPDRPPRRGCAQTPEPLSLPLPTGPPQGWT
eukprot:373360-Pyramimonas_sp.AAC.1